MTEQPPAPAPVTELQLTTFGLDETLKFSYQEVLDATKHQDDKVGRLLGAVAFLTGGALVFANQDVLTVDVLISGRSYPLGAATLGVFLLIDLVAVASFMIAMSAPLTLPRSSPTAGSHLYFRAIAGLSEATWQGLWTPGHLQDLRDEMLAEIRNIAERADRKYGRTAISTNIFLAAVTVLAPTVVVGLAASGRPSLEWDAPLRWCVALAGAVISIALLAPLAFEAMDERTSVKPMPFWLFVFTYPATLVSIVVADPSGSLFVGGGWAIAVFGLASAVLIGRAGPRTRPRRPDPQVIGVLVVTVAGLVAWTANCSDVQLFVSLGGSISIVVPNIVRELRHRPSTSVRA